MTGLGRHRAERRGVPAGGKPPVAHRNHGLRPLADGCRREKRTGRAGGDVSGAASIPNCGRSYINSWVILPTQHVSLGGSPVLGASQHSCPKEVRGGPRMTALPGSRRLGCRCGLGLEQPTVPEPCRAHGGPGCQRHDLAGYSRRVLDASLRCAITSTFRGCYHSSQTHTAPVQLAREVVLDGA